MFPGTPGASTDEWQQFLATDIDQNGEVSAFELQRMLAVGGLVFSLQTVVQIVSLHSPRDKGSLNFDEFRAVKQFLSNIQASFQYFDASKTGKLTKSEVLRALHHAGFGHVDEGAIKASCQAFDPDRSNSLSLDQYIAMTLFLLGAKRAFDAFAAGLFAAIDTMLTADLGAGCHAFARVGPLEPHVHAGAPLAELALLRAAEEEEEEEEADEASGSRTPEMLLDEGVKVLADLLVLRG